MRCCSGGDARQSSEHDLSADPDSNEDDTAVEASDNGGDEMQDSRDPRDRYGKEKDVTVNIPRHIVSAPAVQKVAERFLMSPGLSVNH